MKKPIILSTIFALALDLFFVFNYHHLKASFYNPLDQKLLNFIQREKNKQALEKIIHYLNQAYKDLPQKIHNGEKIKIFLQGAHGLLRNGKSQAQESNRISSRKLPEEYYSLRISRELYTLFKQNQNFEIIMSPSQEDAILGKSDNYPYENFSSGIELAMAKNAQLLISEHLNNVDIAKRPDYVMKKGIFVSRDDDHNPVLIHVTRTARGFLTLFNPNDILGISESVAIHSKNLLKRENFIPDTWGNGIIGDTRFSYFFDFPASIIFESGFLCNPMEEAIFYSAPGQKFFAKIHYQAIVKSFSELTGIDLSKPVNTKEKISAKKIDEYQDKFAELKKMHTALFLIHKGELLKGKKLLQSIQKKDFLSRRITEHLSFLIQRIESLRKIWYDFFGKYVPLKKAATKTLTSRRWQLTKGMQLSDPYIFYSTWKIFRAERRIIQKEMNRRYALLPKKMNIAPLPLWKKFDEKKYLLVIYPGKNLYHGLVETFGKRHKKWYIRMKKKLLALHKGNLSEGIYLLKASHKKGSIQLQSIRQTTYLYLDEKELISNSFFKNIHF